MPGRRSYSRGATRKTAARRTWSETLLLREGPPVVLDEAAEDLRKEKVMEEEDVEVLRAATTN